MGHFNLRERLDPRRKLKHIPNHMLNGNLVFALLTFGFLGLGRGLDEGGLSGLVTQLSFVHEFKMKSGTAQHQADRVSNIAGMVQVHIQTSKFELIDVNVSICRLALLRSSFSYETCFEMTCTNSVQGHFDCVLAA
jgi:hypothetical protein